MTHLVGGRVVRARHRDDDVADSGQGYAGGAGERGHERGDGGGRTGTARPVRVRRGGEDGAAGVDELGADVAGLDADADADAACRVDVVQAPVGSGAADGLPGVDEKARLLETCDDLGHGGLRQTGAGGEVAAGGGAVGEEQLEDRAVVELPEQGRTGGGGAGHVSVSISRTYWKVSYQSHAT